VGGGIVTLVAASGVYFTLRNQAEVALLEPTSCRYEGSFEINLQIGKANQIDKNENFLSINFVYPRVTEPKGIKCSQVGIGVIEEAGLIVVDTTKALPQRSVSELFYTNPFSGVYENKSLAFKNLPGSAILEGQKSQDKITVGAYTISPAPRQNIFRYEEVVGVNGPERYVLLGGEKISFSDFATEVAKIYQPYGETRIVGGKVTLPKSEINQTSTGTPESLEIPTATPEAVQTQVLDLIFDKTDLRPVDHSPVSKVHLSFAVRGGGTEVILYDFTNESDAQLLIRALNSQPGSEKEIRQALKAMNSESEITFFEKFVLGKFEANIKRTEIEKGNFNFELVAMGHDGWNYVLVVRDRFNPGELRAVVLGADVVNKAKFATYNPEGGRNDSATTSLETLFFWNRKGLGEMRRFGVGQDLSYTRGALVLPPEYVSGYKSLSTSLGRQKEVLRWIKNIKPQTSVYALTSSGDLVEFEIPSGSFISNEGFIKKIVAINGRWYFRGQFSTADNNLKNRIDEQTSYQLFSELSRVFGQMSGVFEVLIPLESITAPFIPDSLRPSIKDDRPNHSGKAKVIYVSRPIEEELGGMDVIYEAPAKAGFSSEGFVRHPQKMLASKNSQSANLQGKRAKNFF